MFALPYAASLFHAVFLSSVALGGLGLCRSGFAVNHIDIAPQFAGVIMVRTHGAGLRLSSEGLDGSIHVRQRSTPRTQV